MISIDKYRKVQIEITTFNKEVSKNTQHVYKEKSNMSRNHNEKNSKFVCAICLKSPKNVHDEDHEIKNTKMCSCCPLCQKSESNKAKKTKNFEKSCTDRTHYSTKSANETIKTAEPDVTMGLNLLNEVLTVFKSKKKVESHTEVGKKTVILKDAAVLTESREKFNLKPKLTVSKMFLFSIDEETISNNGRFTILNSIQPERVKKSERTLHKSSSIPLMKLDELKNSLKEKNKSKDSIEEVNRMFATVQRHDVKKSTNDTNRPFVRNGPRVLPVVKGPYDDKSNNKDDKKDKNPDNKHKNEHDQCCQFCQTNYLMSSGDSQQKDDCYHYQKHWNSTACPNCTHTLCCHHESKRKHICKTCHRKSSKTSDD